MRAIERSSAQIPHTLSDSVALSEYLLWRAFKNGDPGAYSLIYRRYFRVLFNYGKRISLDHELIKDCIQELFIKIWNNRDNLSETTSIKYYLFTSLKRKLLDTLRSAYVKQSADQDTLDDDIVNLIPSSPENDDDMMVLQKERVQYALNKLTVHQQRLLQMKFYKNLSNKEIADELGITMQSVYNAVFKALRSLKKQIPVY